MKQAMKTILSLCALCALCGCSVHTVQTIAAQKWEYKVILADNTARAYAEKVPATDPKWSEHYEESKRMSGDPAIYDIDPSHIEGGEVYLKKMGIDGWELVAAIPQIETIPDAEDYGHVKFANVRTGKVMLIFKRPLKTEN